MSDREVLLLSVLASHGTFPIPTLQQYTLRRTLSTDFRLAAGLTHGNVLDSGIATVSLMR